jgi:hypothetical protein
MGDPDYARELVEGDIHAINQKAAGLDSRPQAKTFIYAWIMGAGDLRIGQVIGVEPSEYEALLAYAKKEYAYNWVTKSKERNTLLHLTVDKLKSVGSVADKRTVAQVVKGYKVKNQFLDRTPALRRLKEEDIPMFAKQGFITGLDGRKIWVPSEHLTMPALLQGFESVIMKACMAYYHNILNKKGIPFKQVAMVHDEVQIECARVHADIVGQSVVDGFKWAGEHFKVKCKLDGEYQVGDSWAHSH